jgi:hypothetical protein
MNKTARLKRLSRHLLATTCLTLGGVGAAHATTINETSAPGGSFGHTFAAATNLSSIAALTPGTGDTVSGTLPCCTPSDYFTFTGEAAGQLFTVTETGSRNGSPTQVAGSMEVLNSSDVAIVNTMSLTNAQQAFQAVVPNDGILTVVVNYQSCGECTIDYTIGVQSPTAPEPSTFAEVGLGLGLAGAVALQRRRRLLRNA